MAEKLIIGNWKMNKTGKDASSFIRKLKTLIADIPSEKKIIVCAPFTALSAVSRTCKGTPIKLGAQNVNPSPKGPLTGEISTEMLKEFGVQFVIVGHSERREIYKEDNSFINKKIKAVLEAKMFPILCIGEKLEEREKGLSQQVVGLQLKECLDGISEEQITKIILAYEPIWAISKGDGKGQSATADQVDEMHKFIRNTIIKMYSGQAARKVFIIYGGSVNRENIELLSKVQSVNGYLPGGASLDPEHFAFLARMG